MSTHSALMMEPSVEVQRGAKDQPAACGVGPAELALLDSPSGPFATRVLTVRPTFPQLAVDSAFFRVLLLRLLRLPLPLAPARCRCQRSLEVLGDDVAVCPRCGTLGLRRRPFEWAAARVPRSRRSCCYKCAGPRPQPPGCKAR